MKHWYQKPHPLISDYVRSVLVIDGASEPDPSAPPPVTNGMSALFCRNGRVTLFLMRVPSECWKIDEDTRITCYFFKPFAAACIFGVDARIPFIDLGQVDNVDDLIIDRLNRNCEIIRYATDKMMMDPGKEILSTILKELKLNERTFQRIFKKYVGITPNQYRRICQFQSTFTQLRSNEFQSLTDLAYANGFADQSHFIRSFKEFASTTPKNYLKDGLKPSRKS